MESSQSFNILFLSNMMEEKGVYILIEACSLLKEKGIAFSCQFVGKWSDITPKAFHAKVEQYGLDKQVTAYGAKYGEEKNAFFEQANVFIFPTFYYNECFPLVLLEAMQQGIACISTHEGGIPDIIEDNVTGYIIEKKEAAALASKIEQLICQPNLCKHMGEAGRKRFKEKFTLTQFENKLRDILLENTTHV